MTDLARLPADPGQPGWSAGPDRLTWALLLALGLHGLFILGVTFIPEKERPAPNVLEVTLAHFRSEEAPREADFAAQANQVGSGTETEKRLLTTTERAPIEDDAIRETLQVQQAARAPAKEARHNLVVTRSTTTRKAGKPKHKAEDRDARRAEEDVIERRQREIASLEAQLAREKEAYAKRPKVRQLTSVSTKESFDALYVEAFRREVEEVGTRNFPEQAMRERTFGQVRLMVALNPNGSVREIEVLKSSGYRFLDEAAMRSVRLAAPFAPFPPEMRKITDILEVIRTWKFDERKTLSTDEE
ncbi:MAG: TonB family protein [Pseudomonadota bacterium]